LLEYQAKYTKYILEKDLQGFVRNFVEAIQVLLPEDSIYYSNPFLWTEREFYCVRALAKHIYLLEQNMATNSSIFVGMRGVGKTTLYVAVAFRFLFCY
jgi:hypothetical protein